MAGIRTPIPKSVVRRLGQFFSGSIWAILWRIGIVALGLITIVYVLAAASSTIGMVLASTVVWIIISAAISQEVRTALADIVNRRFYRFKF